jgi:hypothetical protein
MIEPGAIPAGHQTEGEFVRWTTKRRHWWAEFLYAGWWHSSGVQWYRSEGGSLTHTEGLATRCNESKKRKAIPVTDQGGPHVSETSRLPHSLHYWSWTWGTRRHLTPAKTENRNRLNLEPALNLTPTKIRPPTEVLTWQKQAQSSP